MRGVYGFLFSVLLPALAFTFVSFGAIVAMRKARRKRQPIASVPTPAVIDSGLTIATWIGVLIWGVLMLSVASSELWLRYDIWSLRPEQVEDVQVGQRVFADHTSVAEIVNALKSSEWYSVNHGGWADETAIVIRMRSGSEWQLRAGYHLTQHGAVVLRYSRRNGRGRSLGQVFSPALPATLERLGVPLSHWDTAHGHLP